MLSEVPVPPGARRIASVPAGTPDLNGPPTVPEVTQRVDDHRLWIVPGTPGAVIAWFESHRLAGSELNASGTEEANGDVQMVFYGYEVPADGPAVSGLGITIAVAADPAGQSVVRVDSEAIWEPTRPEASLVPSDSTSVVVTYSAFGEKQTRTRDSSDAAVVRHFVGIVNSMPEAVSSVTSCPMIGVGSGDYSIVFRSFTGGTLASVRLATSGCLGAGIDVGDTSVPLTDTGGALAHAVESFLPPD